MFKSLNEKEHTNNHFDIKQQQQQQQKDKNKKSCFRFVL
jgi:hypothetical protein